MTREEMHAEVDAEYAPLLQACDDPWSMMAVSQLWTAEKRSIDVLGHRYPIITNIKAPSEE